MTEDPVTIFFSVVLPWLLMMISVYFAITWNFKHWKDERARERKERQAWKYTYDVKCSHCKEKYVMRTNCNNTFFDANCYMCKAPLSYILKYYNPNIDLEP